MHDTEESPGFVPVDPPKPTPAERAEPATPGAAPARQDTPVSPRVQYAVGALAVTAIGVTGAWQAAGPAGAVAAGVGLVSAAGGVAAWRWRRRHPKAGPTSAGRAVQRIKAPRAGRTPTAVASGRSSRTGGRGSAGRVSSPAAGRRSTTGPRPAQARTRSLPGRARTAPAAKHAGRSWMHGPKPPWWWTELRTLLGLPLNWLSRAVAGIAAAVEEQHTTQPAAPEETTTAAKAPAKAEDTAGGQPEKTPVAPAVQPPDPDPRPTPAPARTHTSMNTETAAVVEAVRDHINNFHPQTPEDLKSFVLGLGSIQVAFAEALKTVADRLESEFPIEEGTREMLREMAASAATLADYGNEIHATYKAEHAHEEHRRENPRPGEEFHDVRNR